MTEAEADAPESEGPTATVLVVDDEEDIREATRETLETHVPECEVVTADSGAAALQILEEHKVHVILTDYRMAEMDGLQFLKKARIAAPHAICLMSTAYPDMDLAMTALNNHHIMNFMIKPVQAETLVETIKEAIRVQDDEAAQARMLATAIHQAKKKQANPPPG